jgi:hypothetical protein
MYEHQAAQTQVEASHQAAVERNRATVAEYQAKDAIARGQQSQTQHQLKVAQMRGSQRARFAAAGLSLEEGSAAAILMDTDFMGKTDELTIADNAEKEAWAFRESARVGMTNADFLARQGATHAAQFRARAGMEDPSRAFSTSLLGGASQVATSWYGMKAAGVRGA